jgi:hypothetical protein
LENTASGSKESSDENSTLLESNKIKSPSNKQTSFSPSKSVHISCNPSESSSFDPIKHLNSNSKQNVSPNVTPNAKTNYNSNKQSKCSRAEDNKENNIERTNSSKKINNEEINPNKTDKSEQPNQNWPHFNSDGSSFETFKKSLNNNQNPFIFARELNKKISHEAEHQLFLKKRNHDIDIRLGKQLEELKKPDGIRNDFLLPPRSSEDWYDLNYLRPSYDVYLVGDSLKNFTDDIYVRHDEIVRCTGIDKDNIITSNQRTDLRNNTIYYKVAVSTLNDFVKILLPWPENAFGSGIKSVRAPIEFLRPSILDVDKSHDFNAPGATKTIINAEKYWSITNISRSQYYDNKTKIDVVLNKLFCRFTKLSLLSKAIKKKIQLDLTSTSHCVSLGPLKLSSCCSKCGSGGHSEKTCKETNCYRCQGNDHQSVTCKNSLKCANCGGPHLCISDLCPALILRSIQDNHFICNFEIQEEIIRHPVQLFKTRLTPEEVDNFCTDKKDDKQIIVDQIRNEIMCTFMPLINNQNTEIEQLKKSVNLCEKRIDKLDDCFVSVNNKIDAMNDDLKSNSCVLNEIRNMLKKDN